MKKYNFKEIKINCSLKKREELIKKIVPFLKKIKRKKKINSFHFLNHDALDFRFSRSNWEENILDKIQYEFDKYIINEIQDIEFSNLHPLDFEFLETGSLFAFEVMKVMNSNVFDLTPWIHYFYNQLGVNNFNEGIREIESGMAQILFGYFLNQVSLFGYFKVLFRLLLKSIKFVFFNLINRSYKKDWDNGGRKYKKWE